MPYAADVELLKELIRIHPVTASVEAVNRVVDRMAEYLSPAGVECHFDALDGRKILYASSVPGKNPDLLLNVHLDVVPVAEAGQTEAVIKDGCIYGRGAGDCLGNAICAARFLIDNCERYSIGVLFSTDEETGGETTRYMAEKGYNGRRFTAVIDGGHDCIAIAQKGVLVLKLRAIGKGGHSAYPFVIDNPIDRLIDGYQKLRAEWQNPTAESDWRNSMVPCIISSGKAFNQVEDIAEMVINFRYIGSDDHKDLIEYVRRVTGLEIEIVQQMGAMAEPEDTGDLEVLRSIMTKHLGKEVRFTRLCGATDARFFRRPGLPVAVIGLKHGGVHSAGEYLLLDSIDIHCRILEELAERLDLKK